MSDQYFAVVFRGDIVFGRNLLEVKQNLKDLFKTDDAGVDRLFIGKPVALKTNLEASRAEHYQQVLEKAGIVVSIEEDITSDSDIDNKSIDESKVPSDADHMLSWALKPLGSLLQDEQKSLAHHNTVDTSNIALAPQTGYILDESERAVAPEAIIDADKLDWEITKPEQ